jgi:hypothetical protein
MSATPDDAGGPAEKCYVRMQRMTEWLSSDHHPAVPKLADMVSIYQRELWPTNLPVRMRRPLSWESSHTPSIYPSPVESSPYYCDISGIDGSFQLVPRDRAGIAPCNFLPPIHFETFQHLPAEILNHYITGVCHSHRREVLTFLVEKMIADSPTTALNTLRDLSMTPAIVVDFVIKILVLIEPLDFGLLKDRRPPIKFDVDVTTSTYVCSRASLFARRETLLVLLAAVRSNPAVLEDFIQQWWNHLEASLRDHRGHLIGFSNTDAIVIRETNFSLPRSLSKPDTVGWIVFPDELGRRDLPQHTLCEQVFPSSTDPMATYAYVQGQGLFITLEREPQYPWVCLPVSSRTNAGLMSSFIETAVSLKYFALLLSQQARSQPTPLTNRLPWSLKHLVLESIMLGSPFFYSHDYSVCQFVWSQLPAAKQCPEEVAITRHLSLVVALDQHPAVAQFAVEQEEALQDLLRADFLRKFQDVFEPGANAPAPSDARVTLPPLSIPETLSETPACRALFPALKRILQPRTSLQGVPLHLVLTELVIAFASYPETEITQINTTTVRVRFLRYVPSWAILLDRNGSQTLKISVSCAGSSTISSKLGQPFAVAGGDLTVVFSADISNHNFLLYSPPAPPFDAILPVYRPLLVGDLTDLFCDWQPRDDQKILVRLPIENYGKPTMRPILNPLECAAVELERPLRLIAFRAQILLTLNFLALKFRDVMELDSFADFRPHMSLLLSVGQFRTLVARGPTGDAGRVEIRRRPGVDVRNGISNTRSDSMIAQFARSYRAERFRSERQPFRVTFKGEFGIDAGGLAREFASELVKDIHEPRVGLFIFTPNQRDSQGSYRDCIVPSPAPDLRRPEEIYTAVGGLLAIQIRCGMTQPFCFPPVFWHFLAGGSITADHIFEIDEAYRQRIRRVLAPIEAGVTAAEFDALEIENEIADVRGGIVRIGRSRCVKMSEAQRFVSQCHACRIGELEKPLRWICNGFWANLGFRPPQFVTKELLEHLICGFKEIDPRELRTRTVFLRVPERQIEWFWVAVDRMTAEQRRKLMQFATGSMTLPPPGRSLRVDFQSAAPDQRLSTASTCFFELHLAAASSAEKMYRSLVTAIEYTGTFENA